MPLPAPGCVTSFSPSIFHIVFFFPCSYLHLLFCLMRRAITGSVTHSYNLSGSHFEIINLIAPAKTLFLNKITLTGPRVEDENIFWGTTIHPATRSGSLKFVSYHVGRAAISLPSPKPRCAEPTYRTVFLKWQKRKKSDSPLKCSPNFMRSLLAFSSLSSHPTSPLRFCLKRTRGTNSI